MTYLAVSILANDEQCFTQQLDRAKRGGAEAVEIRVDGLDEPSADLTVRLVEIVKKAKLPVVVTCRDVPEELRRLIFPSVWQFSKRPSRLARR